MDKVYVYLVTDSPRDEDGPTFVLGVFSDETKARDFVAEYTARRPTKDWTQIDIARIEVDNPGDETWVW